MCIVPSSLNPDNTTGCEKEKPSIRPSTEALTKNANPQLPWSEGNAY